MGIARRAEAADEGHRAEARYDLARRIDCRFLATLVREHRIGEDEAFELAPELAYRLAKRAYRL